MTILSFFKPKDKIGKRPAADPVLKRLEGDCAFWREEMKRSTKEYMKASWDLAIYKQSRKEK